MKWLKRKLRKWVNEAYDEEPMQTNSISLKEPYSMASEPVLNFRVFSAVGGQVVEFSRYDHKTDRGDTTTYIIQKDDDFGEKISKIANLELLK